MWWFTFPALAGPPAWVSDPGTPLPPRAVVDGDRVRVLIRATPEALAAKGIAGHRAADGRVLGKLGWTPITVDRVTLARLAAEGLEVVPDRPIDLGPPPTPVTSALVGATAVRQAPGGPSGVGVRLANIDTHLEITHPHFFRADEGIHEWTDVNGDGVLTPGLDGLDVDGDGAIGLDEVLWRLEAFTWRFDWRDYTYVENHHDGLDPAVDWLYLDLDGDGDRTTGRPAWTDADPGLGEPTFAPDDVDGNGRISEDERLWQLGSSRVEAVWWDGRVFRRGEDLLAYDRQTRGEDRSHGTMVSGILVGGQLVGQRRYAGLAPEADLVFVSRVGVDTFFELVDYTEWVADFGADVLLHEYAPWTGSSMDGSSPIESLVDALAEGGMAQVCPAGNLADAGKHARVTASDGAFTAGFTVPADGAGYLELEAHARPPVALSCALTGPGGTYPLDAAYGVVNGAQIWVDRETSARGNRRHHAMIYVEPPLPEGEWSLSCSGPGLESADVYLSDEWGWDRGVTFDDEDPSRTMGLPATAEHCLAVGAYAGRWPDGDVEPGELRVWSSRGPALGGQKSIDVAAPDDGFTPSSAFGEGTGGSYLAAAGTSGAAPHAAAVAGLLAAANPEWTGVDIRERLRAAADPQGDPDGWGAGGVDAWAALHDGPRPEPAPEVRVAVRTYLPSPIATVEVGDEARWDLDYDGTVDHVGPSFAVPPGRVARVDVLHRGQRLGGDVVRGPVPPEPPRGCATAPGLMGTWLGVLAVARRRR